MAVGGNRRVRSRQVFYIPGYDPFHPRRYRELYRNEGSVQAAITGYDLSLKFRPTGGRFGWSVRSKIDGVKTKSNFDVLVWSDLVRGSMARTIPGTYLQLAQTAWVYVASGALRRLMWMRKGPVIAALYPVVMLLFQLALAIAIGWGVGAALSALIYPGIGWIAALPLILLVLRWFRKMDKKFFAYYLMHDYAFSARGGGANAPELEARIDKFAKVIGEALVSDVDEVLVVGHSSGAHIAVSVLSDLIRKGRAPANGPVLSFLSLGQVVPMVSFLPKADRLRSDLHFLAGRDEISWIDVTAPGDGCAFALCDPVAVTGVAPPDKKWPLVISAAFTKTLSRARWRKLRWRFLRLHFQYLCAFDRPGDYDYFQITAGPLTLGERFAGRAPSKSRIDVPVSCHTTMAA